MSSLFFGKPGMDNKLVGPQQNRGVAACPLPQDTCRVWRTRRRVIGICLTGNLVLSVMLDESVLVPVMCQPAVPFVPWSKERRAALAVPDDDARRAAERARQVQVLGFGFETDTKCPDDKFQTLEQLFGTTCFKAGLDAT